MLIIRQYNGFGYMRLSKKTKIFKIDFLDSLVYLAELFADLEISFKS